MTLAYEKTINKFIASSKYNEYALPVFVKEKSSEEIVGLYEIVTNEIDASPLSVFMNVNFDNASGFGSHDALSDESFRVFRTEIKYLCFPVAGTIDNLNGGTIKSLGNSYFKSIYSIVQDCQLVIPSWRVKDRNPFREPSTYEPPLKTLFGEIGYHTLQLSLEGYEYIFDSDKFMPFKNKQIKK